MEEVYKVQFFKLVCRNQQELVTVKELKMSIYRMLYISRQLPEDPGVQQVHSFSEHDGVDLLLLHVRLHAEPERRHGNLLSQSR